MQETANDEDEFWRRLDWNDLRIFLAVAEMGSLNAAARSLGITQPTISRRMEDLEYRLAARLLERTSRGVTLTEAGEKVRDLANSMARYGDSIMREVAGRDRTHVGRVRLAAPDGIASYVLMPTVARFQMANPDIHLTVDCGLWTDSATEAAADMSLELTDETSADMVSMPIATLHYAVFASPEYLSLYGAPKTLGEAAEHRWVRHASKKEQPRTWHAKAAAVRDLAGQQLVSNSSAATFTAVRHGAGLSSIPTAVVSFAPELVMLDFEPLAHPVLFLRYPSAIANQGRIKRVREWLLDVFDPAEQPWFREEFIHPRDFETAKRTGGGRNSRRA